MGAKIKAIEYHLPSNKLSNSHLAKDFPNYDFKKFERVVGIQNRYVADAETTALDLAIFACNKLFLTQKKEDIDYVLYCTQSPEFILPTTACLLQKKLQLNTSVGALDINLGCSGYTYCLSIAKSLIEARTATNVLIVTADTYSKYLHSEDRMNRSLFGDGATASIVTWTDKQDLGDFLFGTDGSHYDKLILKKKPEVKKEVYTASDATSFKNNDAATKSEYLFMDGSAIFDFTKQRIPIFIDQVIKKNNDLQVDQFILHQANKMLLEVIRKRAEIKKEAFYIDLKDGGNTISSTIPIALKKYSQLSFKEEAGPKTVLLAGFGVGLSWSGGTATIRKQL